MRAAGGTNPLLPESSTSTSAATSGLPQDVEDNCVTLSGNTEEAAVKGTAQTGTQRAKGAATEPSGGEQPASSSIKGSAVYRYSIEDLKMMKEYPSSKLPMDPKSQLAQIMSKMNSTRRNDGYKGGVSRSYGNDEMSYHPPVGTSHPNIDSQGSLLGMPGNLRPSGSLVSKNVPATPVPSTNAPAEGLIASNKGISLSDKQQESSEAPQHPTGTGQPASTRAPPVTTRQTSGFPPPPPPPEKDTVVDVTNGSNTFLPTGATNKQVDTTMERPPSITLMSSSAISGDLWAPQQQQQKTSRSAIPPNNTLAHEMLFHPTPKTHELFGANRMSGDVASPNDVPHMEQPPPVYDYYGHRYGDQMHQQFTASGMNLWGGGPEHDLWDSPVEGGDNDIFTLGDIRQAEHTIETQGISAQSYADLRTRKIFSDVADRSKPPQVDTEASQDLFFFDNNSRLAPGDQRGGGESRFLGMFEANQQHQQQQAQVNPRMPMRPYQPTPATMTSNYMYQPQQQVPTGPVVGQWNGTPTSAAASGGIDRSPDKAMMREHLLKILGLKSGADGKPVQVPPQDMLYKQHQPQATQQPQSIYPPMSTTAAPTRPSNTIFSRPLNPAAPQFSPLGIFNNLGTTDTHSIKKNLGGIPPPPPPADYRRQAGLYDHLQSAPSVHQMPPNSLMWNQRTMNTQQHPMETGLTQDADLSQRIAAKAIPKQQPQPQQTPPITEQQAVAAAQFLQRHLMANANLTPEQIQQVMQFFNKNKSTLLASQLLLANQNAARRKEFESEAMTKEQQAAALLHSAANQFRQQSAANSASKLNMPQMNQPQTMPQPSPQLSNANSQLQSQIQAVHKALQASVARAQAGARGGHTAQEMQRLVSTLQQLQQKSTLLQQQQAQQQQQQQVLMSQQMPRRGAQPGASPVLNAQQQQKYQQQVCIANAIEQLTAMAHRIKTQQQQQSQPVGATQPDMSPQQLISAAQKQLQHKQAQQQHSFVAPGTHLYDQQQQHQVPQRNTSTPSNELKQQLTSALTATIQQNPNKSEQAAANLSALLKNLPPNHNLSQQIHAMLAQQQQQANRAPAHSPSGPLEDNSTAASRFANQLLKSDIASKPSEGTTVSGNGFKSNSATEVDGPPGEGSDKENGMNPSPAPPSSTSATTDMMNTTNEVMDHKSNMNRGDTNEQRLASSSE